MQKNNINKKNKINENELTNKANPPKKNNGGSGEDNKYQ